LKRRDDSPHVVRAKKQIISMKFSTGSEDEGNSLPSEEEMMMAEAFKESNSFHLKPQIQIVDCRPSLRKPQRKAKKSKKQLNLRANKENNNSKYRMVQIPAKKGGSPRFLVVKKNENKKGLTHEENPEKVFEDWRNNLVENNR